MDAIGNDVTTQVLHQALNGLSLRQSTIAADTANIDTPGYLAHRVDFETSLRNALSNGTDPSQASADVITSTDPTDPSGNNVNLDEETLQGQEAGLRYQLVSEAVTNKFALLRSAMKEG